MKEKKHHYTYVIINQKNGKMYIGTRSCNCEPMFDLGVVYFSSSYDKEFMKEQKEHSENFSYQVLIEEESRDKAMEMEIELHCFHDVAKNESFYNKSRQLSAGFDNGGIGPMLGKHHSEESKAKISKATKGRKKSKETRKRMSEGMRGRVRSKEHCENISKAASKRVGWKHSEETKKKISESQKGKTLSPRTYKKYK